MEIIKRNYTKFLSWIITIMVPVLLVLGAVRLVINPWYLVFEYHTPGFPPDEFGFTQQERLAYSRYAADYLVNSADISYLGDLRLPEGQFVPPWSCQYMDDCNLMYNKRELQHMMDVKSVVKGAMVVLYGTLFVLFILGVWAWRGKWIDAYRHGLWRGGWFTISLIGVIILATLLLFNQFFVFFHTLFFAKGTWTFYTSDTLIRLFPERFWRDTFIMVGGITGVASVLLGVCLQKRKNVKKIPQE